MGNISGSPGPSSCGSLGYAMPDAEFAACVVAITDNLIPGILPAFSIPGHRMDFIVRTDTLGDPAKISSGATGISRNPTDLLVASRIATLIRSSPVYRDGFSMQFGTGGASLAVARYLADYMRQDGVKASFVLGGITAQAVETLEQEMVGCIFDVQCFDASAVKSLAANPMHREISASHYANPNRATLWQGQQGDHEHHGAQVPDRAVDRRACGCRLDRASRRDRRGPGRLGDGCDKAGRWLSAGLGCGRAIQVMR